MKWILTFLFLATRFCSAELCWEDYKQHTLAHQPEIMGWCTLEKAEKMMELIHDTHPQLCVEIGVFGGSSIYPTAAALRFFKKGVVYAIDPWAHQECLEGYSSTDVNALWWEKVDLDEVYRYFNGMLQHYNLIHFCSVLRMSSENALGRFQNESIDVLHIDGNHSEEAALSDVQMFLPKVKKGGYIWFDDANWSTTRKAVSYLREQCILETDRSIIPACLLFRKP